MKVKVAQLCPTLWDSMKYKVYQILQPRILEWVTIPFSRGSSQPRDQAQVPHIAGRFFISWATREIQEYWSGQPIPSPVDLPNPRIEPGSPALQADSLPAELPGKPLFIFNWDEMASQYCEKRETQPAWVDLAGIMLSSVSQGEKDKYSVTSLVRRV